MPLVLPPHPPEPAPPGFPWLATVAPVAGAVVLVVVTGSVFSLAFAALGPLVAVASMLDARRQARRGRRRDAAARAEQLGLLRASVASLHEAERAAAWRRALPARGLVDDRRPFDWRDGGPGSLVLGRGDVASAVRVDGTPVDAHDRDLLESAARLEDAPVLARVGGGIGVVGAAPLVGAVARALLVQVASRCRPGDVGIVVPDGAAWSWAASLPHRGGETLLRIVDGCDGRAGLPGDGAGSGAATIALAGTVEELPPGLETVVVVEGPRRAVVERRGDGSERRAIVPELLSTAEASSWAGRVRAAAAREGVDAVPGLPGRLPFHAIPQPATQRDSRATLRAAVGAIAGGPLELDLAARGPHAIVAGTTGSGKSEFLLAWLTALAHGYPPERVAFLLVDFKGGAAFEPIRDLPHVTGIVTDLDDAEAERAVLSLRAELRHRESILRAEQARDLVELAAHVELPRLVIVVDEFQAMIERFPDLGAVVADIAARGRSLGVHLVLASQRPNGVVREQVSANCSIRVSLRVMERADSLAVVGTEAAAAIHPDTPGRGVVDPGDGYPVPFQSALVDAAALERLQRSTAALPRARRPWVGPLPDRVTTVAIDEVAKAAPPPRGALVVGLVDDPERQRHDVATWSPEVDGHLLIVGAPGSGRTTALAAVARAASRTHQVRRIDGRPGAQWDALQEAVAGMRRGDGPTLVIVDDVDVRFRDWPDDHRQAAYRMVETVLREGRARGVALAAAAGSAHRTGPGFRELFGSTALLRHPNRSDLVHAGGVGSLWRADDPPGSGQWHGRRIQFADAPPWRAEPVAPASTLQLDGNRAWAIVSSSPRSDAATLRALGHEPMLLEPGDAAIRAALAAPTEGAGCPRLVVGDADAWMANWALIGLMREEASVVVHGGHREYRVFAPGPALPPLLDDPVRQCWVTGPGAEPLRSTWPLHVDN